MILVKPDATILNISSLEPLELIEFAGRTCYKSEDKVTGSSSRSFVQMLIKNGHHSVIEHVSMTAKFICDRGVSHEIVRHRLASYSQESTRYCDYNKGHLTFIIPPWCDLMEGEYGRVYPPSYSRITMAPGEVWLHCMSDAETHYKQLREAGWKPEEARSVLPNSLKTEIIMTANIREWRHFFALRTSKKAHPQMREVAGILLQKAVLEMPIVFDEYLKVFDGCTNE